MRPAALQDPDLLWIDGGAATCYEKDVAPVDVDAVFSSSCVDLSGNLYPPHSTLRSCCDCFRLENISRSHFSIECQLRVHQFQDLGRVGVDTRLPLGEERVPPLL